MQGGNQYFREGRLTIDFLRLHFTLPSQSVESNVNNRVLLSYIVYITCSIMCKCRRDKRIACEQCFALKHQNCGCCKLHSCCRDNVVLKSRNKSDLIIGCEVVGGSRKENGVTFERNFIIFPKLINTFF